MTTVFNIEIRGAREGRTIHEKIAPHDFDMMKSMLTDCVSDTGARIVFKDEAKLQEFREYWPAFDVVARAKGIEVRIEETKACLATTS